MNASLLSVGRDAREVCRQVCRDVLVGLESTEGSPLDLTLRSLFLALLHATDDHDMEDSTSPVATPACRLAAAADSARVRSWDALHSGCWRDADVRWRDLHTAACAGMVAAVLGAPASLPGPSPQLLHSCMRLLDVALMLCAERGRDGISAVADALVELVAASTDDAGAASPHDAARSAPSADVRTPAFIVNEQPSDATLRSLPRAPPAAEPVPRAQEPSLMQFLEQYMRPSIPVVITGAMQHWPAMGTSAETRHRQWRDLERLRRIAGPRTVPAEVGASYTSDEWGQKLLTVSQLIDQLEAAEQLQAAGTAPRSTRKRARSNGEEWGSATGESDSDSGVQSSGQVGITTVHHAATSQSAGGGAPDAAVAAAVATAPAPPLPAPQAPYLAQYDLLAHLPALARDVCEPEYCVLGQEDEEDEEDDGDEQSGEEHSTHETLPPAARASDKDAVRAIGTPSVGYRRPREPLVRAWLGPAHTVSDAHTDPHDNLLCQVVGCKFVRLVAPAASHCMYPRPPPLTNTSLVNVGRPDGRAHPLFVRLSPWEAPPPPSPPPPEEQRPTSNPKHGVPLVQDVVLRPGEMLFIPRGWWHYVRALTTSFSVSYWF